MQSGTQHKASVVHQTTENGPQPPSSRSVDNQSIPKEGAKAGTTADHQHDIKKAERDMHAQFQQARVEEGDTVSGKGGAPGGPTPARK